MPLSDLPSIPQDADNTRVVDYLIMLRRKLNDFLNHLDTLNVDELDAKVVIANTITADKMNVSQLSAIAADLGHITAGLIEAVNIYGSYIATANGTYPRCEMDSSLNEFAAFYDANNWIKMLANSSGTPLIELSAASGALVGYLGLDAPDNKLRLISNWHIDLVASGGNVYVPSWSKLYNTSSGNNLQSDLDAKAGAFSGFTGTIYVATTSGGSPTTAKTFTNGICTS